MSPFTTPFKLSFFAALLIAMPYVLYQLWAFVAPGLYRKERRFAVPLLVSAILLFYVGVAFAYYFVFPVMFQFFAHTTPKGVAMMTDINNYLDFVLTMFFCFGLAFEVPVAVVLLVVMGVVRVESLAKNRGYVLIGIFILAALLTPPDASRSARSRCRCTCSTRAASSWRACCHGARRPRKPPAPATPDPFQQPAARCACQR